MRSILLLSAVILAHSVPVFVITIRDDRWTAFQQRWGCEDPDFPLNKWEGTNGENLNINQLKQEGKISHHNTLFRGEIGCFDSHYRVWLHMSENSISTAIIFEDDVDVNIARDKPKLQMWLNELQGHNVYAFISYVNEDMSVTDYFTPHTAKLAPHSWQGAPGQIITLDVARVLIQHALPHIKPVDIYVYSLRHLIMSVQVMPSSDKIQHIGTSSDTRQIR